MAKYNRPNGKLFGSSATNIGVFGSGQQNETPATSTDPNTVNGLGTHWEEGWDGAVVSQAPYTAPYIEDMNAVNYVNSYNSAYLLQRGIPEYSATEEYQEDSVCTYNGEIWICLQDNTVGQTPSEGAYWHLQGEVPVMNDNEILVGAIGGTPTVVGTLAQGDILASASGLDIKSDTIVNADINSSAGILESKLALDYATASLNTDIGNVSNDLTTHTSDTSNPHSTKMSNLADTNISLSPSDQDTVVYDSNSSEWINQPNTVENLKDTDFTSLANGQIITYDSGNTKWINTTNSVDNLSNTNISSVTSGDVLSYNGSNWVNQANSIDNLTNTTISSATSGDVIAYDGSKWINQANSVDNLIDTTISSASAGDILAYDNLNSKWINQQNSVDNLSNTTISSPTTGDVISYDGSKWINSQPAGGSLSNLTDTTITTPQQNNILLYDSGSSKWINSGILEVYDIANINNAVSNVSLTANSKRHQIFTATNGFDITLPSTGVKAGESFVFDWKNDFNLSITTPFTFYVGVNKRCVAWVQDFTYIFTAAVDNPTLNSDWFFQYRSGGIRIYKGYASGSISFTSGVFKSGDLGTIMNVPVGHLDINMYYICAVPTGTGYGGYAKSWIENSGNTNGISDMSGGYSTNHYSVNMPMGISNNFQATPLFKTVTCANFVRNGAMKGGYGFTPNATGSYTLSWNASAKLIAPIIDPNAPIV